MLLQPSCFCFSGKYLLPVHLLVCLLSLISANAVVAQPVNDNCSNASPIVVSNGGFGIGVFKSAEINMGSSTALPTEYFHPVQVSSGNDKKSIWYKLVLQTARAVKIELKQPGNAIPQGDAGFTTYRTNSCNAVTLPEIEAAKITPSTNLVTLTSLPRPRRIPDSGRSQKYLYRASLPGGDHRLYLTYQSI